MENNIKIKKRRKVKDDSVLLVKTRGEKILHAVVFAFLAVWALTYILPAIWLVIQTLYEPSLYWLDIAEYGILAFPKNLSFNYLRAFTELKVDDKNFIVMFINSLWYIGLGITFCSFWSWIVGYLFAKYKFKGRQFLYALVIFTMIIPVYGSDGAYYKMITALNLYDTGPLYVIATGIGGFGGNFLIFYGIFQGISWEYAESVFIDGGGHNTVFWKIMLPQAMPAIGAMLVTSLITLWNEYYVFLMFLPSWPTVATGLYMISIQKTTIKQPIYYSGLIICTIPVIILFCFSVDSLMKNLSIGGLKG